MLDLAVVLKSKTNVWASPRAFFISCINLSLYRLLNRLEWFDDWFMDGLIDGRILFIHGSILSGVCCETYHSTKAVHKLSESMSQWVFSSLGLPSQVRFVSWCKVRAVCTSICLSVCLSFCLSVRLFNGLSFFSAPDRCE